MIKSKTLSRLMNVAAFAMMFGAASVHAQSSGAADATSKDAAGKTSANRAGQMSPTGENETTSARPTTGSKSGQ